MAFKGYSWLREYPEGVLVPTIYSTPCNQLPAFIHLDFGFAPPCRDFNNQNICLGFPLTRSNDESIDAVALFPFENDNRFFS